MAITSVAPTIDATGISAPSYADILAYVQGIYQSIYGQDVYLEADSQDGQFLAMMAAGFNDINQAIIQAFNSFSPSKAQGEALSSNVKINGLRRAASSYSTADLHLIGQVGTTITNGIVRDANQNQWALPASVTIPPAGEITVTATCTALGAIAADVNTINQIATPTRGWQTVTNSAAAVPGAPVEVDAQLRVRQAKAVSANSKTVLGGVAGAISLLNGVESLQVYENDTETTDGNGLPAHSISAVVNGGDAAQIATVIARMKGPGATTYGTTSEVVTNSQGFPTTINFFRPTTPEITVAVTIKALSGYDTSVGASLQAAVSDYITNIPIGGGNDGMVDWDGAVTAAKSVTRASTFKIVTLSLSGPGGAGEPDVPIAFTDLPACDPSSVALTVT